MKRIFLLFAVMAAQGIHAHPFPRGSAMQAIGSSVEKFFDLPDHLLRSSSRADWKINRSVLSGQRNGLRKSGPNAQELTYILAFLHIASLHLDEDAIRNFGSELPWSIEKQDYFRILKIFLKAFRYLGKQTPQWTLYTRYSLIKALRANFPDHAKLMPKVADIIFWYFPEETFWQIALSDRDDKLKVLQRIFNTTPRFNKKTLKQWAQEQMRLDPAPNQQTEVDDPSRSNPQTTQHSLADLEESIAFLSRLTQQSMLPEMDERKRKNYQVHLNYLETIKHYYNMRKEIVSRASSLWDDAVRNKKSLYDLRQEIEDIIVKNTPTKKFFNCYENLDSIGWNEKDFPWYLPTPMPNTAEAKEHTMLIVGMRLEEGPIIITKVAHLLKKHPELISSYVRDVAAAGWLCIPGTNRRIEEWYDEHREDTNALSPKKRLYIASTDTAQGPDAKITNAGHIYQDHLFQTAQMHDKTLTKSDLHKFGTRRPPAIVMYYDPYDTLDEAVEWIHKTAKEAYADHHNASAFATSVFANQERVRAILDDLAIF